MAISSVPSATAQGYGQLQRQVAQRNAEQLAAKAAALAAQAASAREDADAAIQRADQLETESGSARTKAEYAWQAVSASTSAVKTGETIGKQAERIYQSLQSTSDLDNLYGSNGQTSNTSYSAGSIFKLAG